MSSLPQLRKYLKSFAQKERIGDYLRFFKTGKGQYGEGDKFIGVTVPNSRGVARKFSDLTLNEVERLIRSKVHEERLVALLILVDKFKKAEGVEREKIYKFYLANIKHINNWDLVDLSAPNIVGEYLTDKNTKILYKLARSKSLWDRRIAIISTHSFIRRGHFKETLEIAESLLTDKHDLIHKAIGWMLREVGKRSEKELVGYLKKNYKAIPRTSLRYAIERFPKETRIEYLKGNI